MKTKDLTLAALFAGFISISSYIVIPLPVVPFSLQVFAVSLTAICLTRKQALFAILTYTLVGLIGLPVFAGGRGGFQVILSPSFGFILGFIPMVFIINTLFHKLPKGKRWLAFIAGSLSLYAVALPILYFNLKLNTGTVLPLSKLLVTYWLIFLPTDCLSMGLSYLVQTKILPFTQSQTTSSDSL